MIKIASAGRSGSAWLCNILSGVGLKTVHEFYPYNVTQPDAVADTTWMMNPKGFWDSLSPSDTLVVIDRETKGRLASIHNLLGEYDSTYLDQCWADFVLAASEGVHPNTYLFSYESLFDLETRDQVRHMLFANGHSDTNLDNMWNASISMRITNWKSELNVRRALGLA